jgi:hypothetical protein
LEPRQQRSHRRHHFERLQRNLAGDRAVVRRHTTASVTLNTIGTQTITATDISDASKTANTSPSITVNIGPASS